MHCETLAPALDDLAQRVCAADADDADASVGGGADSQRRAAPLVAMIDVDANDLPDRYELGRVPAVALLRAHRPGHPLVYAGAMEGEPLFEWLRSVARGFSCGRRLLSVSGESGENLLYFLPPL